MKISELIEKLQEALEDSGDEDVVIEVHYSGDQTEDIEDIVDVSLDGYIVVNSEN